MQKSLPNWDENAFQTIEIMLELSEQKYEFAASFSNH